MKSFALWRPLLAALLAIITMAGLAPAAQAQNERLIWSPIGGIGADISLASIFMLDSEHAWAVGHSRNETAGYAYRLTLLGGRWQIEPMGSFSQPLYAVAALGVDSAWAVGANGLIVRYGASGWQQLESPAPAANLRAIQMLGDGSQGWAMGESPARGPSTPVALRYSGGRWQSAAIESGPDGDTVRSLHLSAGGGWAVGSSIWRLRDGAWQREAVPSPCGDVGCGGGFSAVRAIDGQRAVAVGAWSGTCAICTGHFFLAERGRDGWQARYADGNTPLPAPESFPDTTSLGGLYFSDAGNGLAVGNRRYPHRDGSYGPDSAGIFGLRYADGAWAYEPILSGSSELVAGLSMTDASHALLVGSGGLLLSYGYGDQRAPAPANPTAPVANPNLPGVAYFGETGHSLRGTFRAYWERYGGLAQFGFPLTEEYSEVSATDGRAYTVQYFERARFEYHPENAGSRYEVLLGLLGHTVAAGRAEPAFQPAPPTGQPGSRYFPETGHSMAAEFVSYWDNRGGLALYGYPISDPFYEVNAADGRSYLVQYFERNRFEYHPEKAGTPFEVLLGLLGREVLVGEGWLQ